MDWRDVWSVTHGSSHVQPLIEAEVDDEGTSDYLMLERWQDLQTPFRLSDR